MLPLQCHLRQRSAKVRASIGTSPNHCPTAERPQCSCQNERSSTVCGKWSSLICLPASRMYDFMQISRCSLKFHMEMLCCQSMTCWTYKLGWSRRYLGSNETCLRLAYVSSYLSAALVLGMCIFSHPRHVISADRIAALTTNFHVFLVYCGGAVVEDSSAIYEDPPEILSSTLLSVVATLPRWR
jgi:hypothetical protein